MKMHRRNLFKVAAGASAASILMPGVAFGEDMPMPKTNRFMLYIHLGSACGMASGLIQPTKPNEWPLGFFQEGKAAGSNNPLINSHTASGGMFFHDYLKFLAPMAAEMCLVNGTPQSLDHGVARNLQTRGSQLATVSAEWAMSVGQFMRTDARKNPFVITDGVKAPSVSDITSIRARSLDEFQKITTDVNLIRQRQLDPIWGVLKNRFSQVKPGTVLLNPALGDSAAYQLNTLAAGLPELNKVGDDINALRTKLNGDSLQARIKDCADRQGINDMRDEGFREQLILAGILAKTGIANGMTIDAMFEDMHAGGSDVLTARRTSAVWAYVSLFWEWAKAAGLSDDMMIVVGQEFARSPYNKDSMNLNVKDASGKDISVNAAGRDHGLSMGMMFINPRVPSGGRIGHIGDNMVPQGTKDAKGTVDTSIHAFTNPNIVGSMMMRVFDELFPTERMVRKHWPDFAPIDQIVS